MPDYDIDQQNRLIAEQCNAIANQAAALGENRVHGPRLAAALRILRNAEALVAYIEAPATNEPAPVKTLESATCKHCSRSITRENGAWVDPEATGDDAVWRETCDAHDTFTAEHEPDDNGYADMANRALTASLTDAERGAADALADQLVDGVLVLTIDHHHGFEVSVHRSHKSAMKELAAWVDQSWTTNGPTGDMPDDPEEAVKTYFDFADETYHISPTALGE